eukprot:SAG11_NODE_1372_length_5095_cov_15.640312_3_plen_162_part_00
MLEINMAISVTQAFNEREIVADSNYENLRLFTVANPGGNELAVDVNSSTNYTWGVLSPSTVAGPTFKWFSAVFFLCGRDLYTGLGGEVPIGLVASNVGGTFIQLWSSGDALAACPAKTESLVVAGPSTRPVVHVDEGMLAGGALWNTMIVLLLTMAFRGVC